MSEILLETLALQQEAARLGFDWRHLGELWDKLAEEIGELREAVPLGASATTDELGDLLFMAVNIARHLNIDPAAALGSTNRKFERRFRHIADNLEKLPPMGDPRRIDAMEVLWQEAKRFEKSEPTAT